MNKSAVLGFLLGIAGFVLLVGAYWVWKSPATPDTPAQTAAPVTRPATPTLPPPKPTPPPAPVVPTILTLNRDIPNGVYAPGQTLDITLTINTNGTDPVRAMGHIEDLPAGFAFAGVVAGDHPDLSPPRGRESKLEFAWFNIPDFPTTFTYRVNVPPDAAGPITISGESLFRTTGPELRSPVELTTINPGGLPAPEEEKALEPQAAEETAAPPADAIPPNLSVSRKASDEGYTPGEPIAVEVILEYTSTEEVMAMALVEMLPPGWTFGEVTGGDRPAVARTGEDGEVTFVWVNVPEWPAAMTYTIVAPEGQTGPCHITGYAVYRASGPELQSEPAVTELLPKAG